MTVPAFADPSQTGSFPTSFTPHQLAVDSATGDVYVLNTAAGVVQHYSASGASLGQLSVPSGTFAFGGLDDDIAVDNSGGPTQGNVYVIGEQSGGPGLITAFDAAGRLLWQYTPFRDYPPGTTDTCGVAVDVNGNLWVGDYDQGIQQRSPADGSPIGSPLHQSASGTCKIASDSTGAFYVAIYQGALDKYTPTITGTSTTIDGGSNLEVATDSVYNDVYSNHGSSIVGYDSTGTALSGTPFGTSTFGGVAVDGAHGTILLSDAGSNVVQIWSRGKGSPKPYARLGDASNITATGATLNATVNPAGDTTTCTFEYGTTTSYGSSAPCASAPGNGTSGVPVSADVTGLSGGTTYYYRVVATNSAGAVNSSTATFVTSPLAQHTVTVVVNGTGTGRVDADPGPISGCTSSTGTCSGPYDQGSTPQLRATANMHSRVTRMSVTAGNAAPTTCTSASVTNPCTVTVNEDLTVTVTIDKIQHTVRVTQAGTGSGTVTSSPAGIACGATCSALFDEGSTVRLAASASTGSTFAGWSGGGCSGTGACDVAVNADTAVTATFTENAPTATTGSASGVGDTVATVGGSVNPNGNATSCHFDYGTTTAYGSTAPCASSPGSGSSAVGVSASLSGLAAGTTYHYRLVASNGGGTTTGSDATFTTTTPPPGCPQDLSKCTTQPTLQFAGFASKTLLLKLTCKGYTGQPACSGKLTFKAVIKVRVKHGKKFKLVKRTLTVGTASYSVAANSTKSVKLVLTAAAKRQLKKGGLTARAAGLNATIKLPKTKVVKHKKRH